MAEQIESHPKKQRTDSITDEFDKTNPFTKGSQFDEIELKFDTGESLFISKSFLSYASPVFKRMFQSQFKESSSKCVKLTGKNYNVFLDMLLNMHPRIGKPISDHHLQRKYYALPLEYDYKYQVLQIITTYKMGCCNSKSKADKKKSYLLETLEGHEAGINCMALSEDGSVLATGSEDKTARLWSTKTSKSECIGILRGHEEYINCILIEDCFVLTGSADKTVRKWDVSTCECVLIMRGHTSVIYRMICTGDFIFTSSYDRTARCWDFDMGECIRVFRGHKRGVYPLIFIPGDDDEAAEDTFDASDATKDMLITGSADFTARTWNFETGQCLKVFKGHTGAITCMATDTMGRVLFTGSTDNSIRSWNLLKGEQLKLFSGHQGSVICMQVINKILYSGSSDHTGRAWVTEFGDCTRIYKGHKHTVSVIKMKDGLVYTGSGDSQARCHDSKSGTVQRIFSGHTLMITSLQVVDGKLFTGSYDGCVKVWDITGINDDTTFGNEEEEKKKGKDVNNDIEKMGNLDKVDKNQNGIHSNGQEKIMID